VRLFLFFVCLFVCFLLFSYEEAAEYFDENMQIHKSSNNLFLSRLIY
jgi:hypothetical protein